jgi:hypothetical protein
MSPGPPSDGTQFQLCAAVRSSRPHRPVLDVQETSFAVREGLNGRLEPV